MIPRGNIHFTIHRGIAMTLLLYHCINYLPLISYKMYMIWTADKNSKGMLCSPHHEIFTDISYHFKFNPNIQFRIPELKTT